jgi:hypothetical protein
MQRTTVIVLFVLIFFLLLFTACSEYTSDATRPDLARKAYKNQQTRLQY